MATRQSQRALTKEYKLLSANPPPFVIAKPNDENILEWHYVITGPPESPYEDGQYHGILRFPKEYPFKPPSISMVTPNGRFACNQRLCLSISDFHPDTWNPAWSVSTILTGLLSFMTGDEKTAGSITSSDSVKRKLARESKEWNMRENVRFRKQFPDLVEQNRVDVAKAQEVVAPTTEPEKAEEPINIGESLEFMDPEDRARLSQEDDIRPASIPSLTVIGMVVAAFVAVYCLVG
ncbi:ubiquitin-conjugating enzyme E2 6 [Suhomyces tanzawaensis NRRL Y-17324]|uniref:Ubiquitin-conjugating enzyme E2 6 n=1 Tax=Suhomyces tanzawaensis NRRL Y-17324 TaxID=984487 RepID=A0A1E4SII2_9ASCO|nr:ubiquitin-conjugating enzyme E2 6 [Suhomyces tanzawaensis NRRL Y-17324]ODV79242.1 ubiquitin-conjugating enzyme E2 6 [Suhomyces tanzawaensis NRRL Y-17324]